MDENFEMPSQLQEERTYFIPVLLIAISLLSWTAFQTFQLVKERTYVKAVLANQSQTVNQAEKLRAQLDSIAKGTLQLANLGNPSAKLIVEELRKRGVTINPNNPPANPTK
jgi:hypothetical protein